MLERSNPNYRGTSIGIRSTCPKNLITFVRIPLINPTTLLEEYTFIETGNDLYRRRL